MSTIKKTFIYNLRNYTDEDPFIPNTKKGFNMFTSSAMKQAKVTRRFQRIFMNCKAHTPLPSANPSNGPPSSAQQPPKPPKVQIKRRVYGRFHSAGLSSSSLTSSFYSGFAEEQLQALEYSSKLFFPRSFEGQLPLGSVVEIRSVRELMSVHQQTHFTTTFSSIESKIEEESRDLDPTPLSHDMVSRLQAGTDTSRIQSVRPSGVDTPVYDYNRNADILEHDIDQFLHRKRLFLQIAGFESNQETLQVPRWALNLLRIEEGTPIFVRLSTTEPLNCVVPSKQLYWNMRFLEDKGDKFAIGRDGERKLVNSIKRGYSVLTDGQILKVELNDRDVLLSIHLKRYKTQKLPTLLNTFQSAVHSLNPNKPGQAHLLQLFYYNDISQGIHFRVEYARPGTALPEEIGNLDYINQVMGVQQGAVKKGELEYSDINALLRERGMDFDLMEKFFSAKREAHTAKGSGMMSRASQDNSPKRYLANRKYEFPTSPSSRGRESAMQGLSKDIKSTVTFQAAKAPSTKRSPARGGSNSPRSQSSRLRDQKETQAVIFNSVLAPQKMSGKRGQERLSGGGTAGGTNLSHIEDANGVYYDVRSLIKKEEVEPRTQRSVSSPRSAHSTSPGLMAIGRGVRSPYDERRIATEESGGGPGIDLEAYMRMEPGTNIFSIDTPASRDLHTSDFKYRKEMEEHNRHFGNLPLENIKESSVHKSDGESPKTRSRSGRGERIVMSKASHRDGTITISGPMTPKAMKGRDGIETDLILFKSGGDGGISSAVESGSDDENAFRGRREPRFSEDASQFSKKDKGKRGSQGSGEMIKIRENLPRSEKGDHERSLDSTLMMSGERQGSNFKQPQSVTSDGPSPSISPIKMEATITQGAGKLQKERVMSETSDQMGAERHGGKDLGSPLIELSRNEGSISSKPRSTSSKRVALKMGQPPVLGVGAEEQLMEKREELNRILSGGGDSRGVLLRGKGSKPTGLKQQMSSHSHMDSASLKNLEDLYRSGDGGHRMPPVKLPPPSSSNPKNSTLIISDTTSPRGKEEARSISPEVPPLPPIPGTQQMMMDSLVQNLMKTREANFSFQGRLSDTGSPLPPEHEQRQTRYSDFPQYSGHKGVQFRKTETQKLMEEAERMRAAAQSRGQLSRTPHSAVIRYLPGGRAGAPPSFMHHRKTSGEMSRSSAGQSWQNQRLNRTQIVTQSDLLAGMPGELPHDTLEEQKQASGGDLMEQARKMIKNEFIQGAMVSAKKGNEFTQRLKRMHMRSRDAKEAVLGMVTGGKFVAPRVPASMAGGMLKQTNLSFF